MLRSHIWHGCFGGWVSGSVLSVLFFASAGSAQEMLTNEIQTSPELISTQAADLEADLKADLETDLGEETIAPPTPKLHTPQREPIPVFESSLSPNELVASTLSFSTVSLPDLQLIPASLTADSPDPSPSPDPATVDQAEPSPPAPSTLSSENSYDPNASLRIPPNLGEGRPIERVYIHLSNPPEDTAQSRALQRQLADTFGIRAGGSFSPLFADQGVNQVRQLPFVQSAEYRLYESDIPGSVIVALLVTIRAEETAAPSTQPA